MDGDCLPCATLWRRRTPDSALTHCHSAHCPLHSLAHFRRYSPVRFFLRVRREPLRPPSASVRLSASRPSIRPPVALRPLSVAAVLTQFLPAMLHQRFLLLLLRRVVRGPSAVRPRVDGNGIKKRPVRAAPFRTGSSGNRGGLGETDDGRRV